MAWRSCNMTTNIFKFKVQYNTNHIKNYKKFLLFATVSYPLKKQNGFISIFGSTILYALELHCTWCAIEWHLQAMMLHQIYKITVVIVIIIAVVVIIIIITIIIITLLLTALRFVFYWNDNGIWLLSALSISFWQQPLLTWYTSYDSC